MLSLHTDKRPEEQMGPQHIVGILGLGLVYLSTQENERGSNKKLFLRAGVLGLIFCGGWQVALLFRS